MKQIFSIALLCIGFCLPSFGQKTAQEYFNVSARLYAEQQNEAALYTVSRACELFESDSSLAQLKRLIDKNDNNNQQNQQNNNDQDDGNQEKEQQQNQSGQDQKQEKQQNDQDNEQQNQQQQQNAENQEKNEDENKNKEQENQAKDKKGQISEIQAEMLLDAIDNDDKAIQQRLKLQRQNKQNQNRIEKNW